MGKQQFRTRPDGTVYPLRKRSDAVSVVAAGAIAIAAESGGLFTGGSVGGASGALSSAMRTKVADAKAVTSKGKPARAWRQLGLKQRAKKTADGVNCVAHSFGAVRGLFLITPCRSLYRRSGDVNPAAAALWAQHGVRFSGRHYDSARVFRYRDECAEQ